MIDIGSYSYHDLKYSLDAEGYLHHGYSRDLHIAFIPGDDQTLVDRCQEEIDKAFTTLNRFDVTWTEKNTPANYKRLFARRSGPGLDEMDDRFSCLLFEDKSPRYVRKKDKGYIQNINVDRLESRLQESVSSRLYLSKELSVFFHMAVLVLGTERLGAVLHGRGLETEHIEGDILGTEGWKDFEEFITVADVCADWLVLRNFEYLPNDFFENDKDVDLLCRDIDVFSQTMNCTKRSWGIAAYQTVIDKRVVPIDIRYVGDGYYDTVWESAMLDNRVFHHEIVPRMGDVDYFYSLLYHAKVQKQKVKEVYVTRLDALAKRIALSEYAAEDIYDDKVTASIIEAFLLNNSYAVSRPIDREVPYNNAVTTHMSAKALPTKAHKVPLIARLLAYVPSSFFSLIPGPIKVMLKRLLYRDQL